MIGVDTNVLIRLLAQDDDAQQSTVAARWFRRHAEDGVYVDAVVLCEMVWVLRARYGKARAEIAEVLHGLLEVEGVVVGDPSVVRRALVAYRKGPGDFADYLLRERAAFAGAEPLATFDRSLRAEPGFHLLG